MMDAFAKYSVLDWAIMLQVVLIWLYISFNAGGWIFGLMARIGWRWWNRKDKKTLAMDTFYEAFNLEAIQPGESLVVKAENSLTIRINRPDVKRDA